MAREKTVVLPTRVCIPAGIPPILLPTPSSKSAPVPTPTADEDGLDLLSGSSGLLDAGAALENGLEFGDVDLHELPEPPSESEGPQFTEEGIPTDETILAWVRAIRAKRLKTRNEFLSREALQFWVQYSYDPSGDNARWRAVRERLGALVRS